MDSISRRSFLKAAGLATGAAAIAASTTPSGSTRESGAGSSRQRRRLPSSTFDPDDVS